MISTDGSLGIAKKDSAQHGFTLLEIMMVLAVLSIVFVGLFGVFRTALIASEKTERFSAFSEMCRLVTEQLSDDMESLYPLPVTNPSEDVIVKYPFICRDNAPSRLDDVVMMDFHTTSSLRFDSTYPVLGINRVQWVLRPTNKRNEDGDMLYKFLRKELPVTALDYSNANEEDVPWTIVEMADSIRSLDLLFYDEQGLDTTAWDSADSGILPSRLKVDLKFGGRYHRTIDFVRWWTKENE